LKILFEIFRDELNLSTGAASESLEQAVAKLMAGMIATLKENCQVSIDDVWLDIFSARYWQAWSGALQLLGLEPEVVKTTRALDLMPRVIKACQGYAPEQFLPILEVVVESGRHVGRQLDALRLAWACTGVGEPDWAIREGLMKVGEPTLASIGRQGNASRIDDGTLTSIAGLHLIARQIGVSRRIMVGNNEPEQGGGGFLTSLIAGFRTHPLKVAELTSDDRLRLQVILLTALQRAAYHLRALIVTRAVFHPVLTTPEDGITSSTIWDAAYYRKFCGCWDHHPDFTELQWLMLGHAVTNLKQRWEGFACAAVADLAGVPVTDRSFPQQILQRLLKGRPHLIIDRSEKIIRLLNWIGQPAAAKHFSELLEHALLDPDYHVSVHTLFRFVLQLSRFTGLSVKLADALQRQLATICRSDGPDLTQLTGVLDRASDVGERGVYLLTQCLLCCGRSFNVTDAERRRFAERLESHLEQLSVCWSGSGTGQNEQSPGKGVLTHRQLHLTLPERRFEGRWWIELADIYRRCGEYDRGQSWKTLERALAGLPAESAVTESLDRLRSSCLEEEDMAAGILMWYELADVLISTAGRRTELVDFRQQAVRMISAGEVPLERGDKDSPQQEKIEALKRMLPPAQFVRYMDMCIRGWPCDSKEFCDLCAAAVHEVIRITYEEICPGNDRLEFIRSIRGIRGTILETALAAQAGSDVRIPPLVLAEWLELLDHRLLIEQYLTGEGTEKKNEGAVVPPGTWGAEDTWFGPAETDVAGGLESWQQSWRQVAKRVVTDAAKTRVAAPSTCSMSYEEADVRQPDQIGGTHRAGRIRCISDVPAELRDAAGFRSRLQQHLGTETIWVKTIFDQTGRLKWWAFQQPPGSSEPRLVASGDSRRGAARRIQLESEILDARIEAAYEMLSVPLDDWRQAWEVLDPGAVLRRQLPENLDEGSPEQRQLRLSAARKVIQRLRRERPDGTQMSHSRTLPKLPCVARLAEAFCNAIDSSQAGSIEREVIGWKETVKIIEGGWLTTEGLEDDTLVRDLDRVLNATCAAHTVGISRELNLESLRSHLNENTDLLFTLDGPLSSAPLEQLLIAGSPLCHQVRSITAVLSTSLAVTEPLNRENAAGRPPVNELFAVVWEAHQQRSEYDGLNGLHAGLHQLCRTPNEKVGRWSCCSAVDNPRADSSTIQATLADRPFPIIAIGGHGLVGHHRNGALSRKSRIQVAPTHPESAGSGVWEGDGDLRGNEALILCACLVGRLFDDHDDGIRGLFTETLVAGGRVFMGARWTVHSDYSAIFCLKVVEQLMESLNDRSKSKQLSPFRVARVVNQVRRELLREMPGAAHAISAFTCFGLSGLPVKATAGVKNRNL